MYMCMYVINVYTYDLELRIYLYMYVYAYMQMDDTIVNIPDTTNNNVEDDEGKIKTPVCS